MDPRFRLLMRADLHRYGRGLGFRAFCSSYLHDPGFRYTVHLRSVARLRPARRSWALVPYLFHRLLLRHYRFRYGFDLSPLTSIGPGLFIGHFGGLVVSPHATLGANVNLSPGVTIGATSRGAHQGAPTIEDRVWIGTHAILVGKITVGHDALIAPGAYVNFDVPPRSVVLGNPGKIVSDAGSQGYINHVFGELSVRSENTLP